MAGRRANDTIVVTGVSVGLPGRSRRVFADDNFDRLLEGANFIDRVEPERRERIVQKRVVRAVKGADRRSLEPISRSEEVLGLAGQAGTFDLVEEFGVDPRLVAAFDTSTRLAVAAALLALRDAGIPLVRREGRVQDWGLPDSIADSFGVVFASAFPVADSIVAELNRFHEDRARRELVEELGRLREQVAPEAARALDERRAALEAELERAPYHFDRKFLFRAMPMAHGQIAELIGARGANTHVNAACASMTQALAIAEDWLRTGRCRRVLVVSADEASSPTLLEWVGTGFLAAGAATTEADVQRAALPFDRRRSGMIMGMGASGMVLETAEAARERGTPGLAELVGVEMANSAFHGSRMDPAHIAGVMDRALAMTERRLGVTRAEMAPRTVFFAHETYTPPTSGSAEAELGALRRAFGERASEVLVANTKGMTGHPMGAGVEDAVAVKSLQTGLVPPVANLREPDAQSASFRFSTGGRHAIDYAVRLAAGFGSQIAISVLKRVAGTLDRERYRLWLQEVAGAAQPQVRVDHNTLKLDAGGAAQPPQPRA